MHKWLCSGFLMIVIVVGNLSPVSAEEPAEPDVDPINWDCVSSIDPLDPATSDFLETDLSAYREQAWEAYQAGDYELAARLYIALLAYDINNSGEIYNLACCYGLLGEPELAARYLELAVAAGFENVGHAQEDPDFDAVRDDPLFAGALDLIIENYELEETERGNVVFFKADTYLRGRLYLPEGYDPAKPYKLIVGLHGFGSYPDRFVKLWKRFGGADFIYVVPRAPYPFKSSLEDVGYSWGFWTPGEGLPPKSWEMSEEYIGDVIEEMNRLYNIEETYLFGFSQGAGMTLTAGIKNHMQLSGLIAFGGWLDDEWLGESALKNGAKLRVFVSHGNEDGVVEFDSSVKAVEILESYGYDVTFHEFEGGHAVPEEAVQAAKEWMFAPPEPNAGP